MVSSPGSHIRKVLLVAGLGFLFVLPLGAHALTIDTALTITEPKHLSQIFDHQPVIRVSVSDSAKSKEHAILLDAAEVARVTPHENTFIFRLEKPLTSGIHFLNIRQGDLISLQTIFEVLPYPLPPTIESPREQEVVKTSRPIVRGTAERGATARLLVDGKEAIAGPSKGELTIGQVTTFTHELPPLSSGAHTLEARITDLYGTVSAPSQAVSFTVASPVPAPTLKTPVVDTRTTRARPFIVGTVQNELTVAVYIDGVLDGKVATKPNPTGIADFSYQPKANLSSGTHTIVATAEHSLAVSPPSSAVTYNIAEAKVVSEPPTVLGEEIQGERDQEVMEEGEEVATGTEEMEEEEEEDEDEEEMEEDEELTDRERTILAAIIVAVLIGLWWFWQRRGGAGGGTAAAPPPTGQSSPPSPSPDQQSFWS